MQDSTKTQRSRLLDYEEPSLAPFARAESATDCSIYWCGVAQFPMSAYERAWQLEFLRRLAQRLKELRPWAKSHFATYDERKAYFAGLVAEELGR